MVFTKFDNNLCQQNMQFLFSESSTWIRKMKKIVYFVTNTLQQLEWTGMELEKKKSPQ